MNASAWTVGVALLAGSLRAAQLWRANTPVGAVNAVILAALAEGKSADVPAILKAGRGLYSSVALRIYAPPAKWLPSGGDERDTEVRALLDRDARAALFTAYRRLQRLAWLDYVALGGILYTGVSALTDTTSTIVALELLAATLLWFANMYGARALATSLFAGSTALIDSLLEARSHLPAPLPDTSSGSSS